MNDIARPPGLTPTIGGSTYVKPAEMEWKPTRFDKVSIKVLYEDRERGEMTCLLKLEPGAHIPFHKHPESRAVAGSRGFGRGSRRGRRLPGITSGAFPGRNAREFLAERRGAVRGLSQAQHLLPRGARDRRVLTPVTRPGSHRRRVGGAPSAATVTLACSRLFLAAPQIRAAAPRRDACRAPMFGLPRGRETRRRRASASVSNPDPDLLT